MVFVRPVIRKMLGVEPLHRPTVRAVTEGSESPADKRRTCADGWTVDGAMWPAGRRPGSHRFVAGRANALIVVPEDVTEVPEGVRSRYRA